eukprot:403343245
MTTNLFENYETFKEQTAPILYDYYYPHKLEWPASCCRWGEIKVESNEFMQQEVFFGCRTDGRFHEKVNAWQGLGSLVVMGYLDIPKPGYRVEKERKRMTLGKRYDPNQRIDIQKVFVHPGEINCLKCWPKNKRVIATHSDTKNVYVWDFNKQRNAHDRINIEANTPDLILTGHTDVAAYALDWSSTDPIVASGGRDRQILIWNIDNYFNTSGKITEEEKDYTKDEFLSENEESQEKKQNLQPDQHVPASVSRIQKSLQSYLTDSKPVKRQLSTLEPQARLQGHSGNIEDLVFKHDSPFELVSVGIDRYILFWDLRVGSLSNKGGQKPVQKAVRVHQDDINTVDWSKVDCNLVATGSNDKKVVLIDIRKLTQESNEHSGTAPCPAIVRTLEGHQSSINVVRFSPFSADYIASSSEALFIWDLRNQSQNDPIFFKHAGHVGQIVDFEWNGKQSWSFISASDDIDQPLLGSSLQLFRPLDLLLMDETESESILESYSNKGQYQEMQIA